MLDTLLEIGKILKSAKGHQLKHYCVQKPSVGKAKINITTCVVSVAEDGTFDFAAKAIKPIENQILGYMMLKEFVTDNRRKYIFGDIYRFYDPKTKKIVSGNYTLGKDKDKKGAYDHNSLDWGEDVALDLIPAERVRIFRQCFRDQQQEIHDFLNAHDAAYIHFDFAGECWYQLPEWTMFELGMNRLCFNQLDEVWTPKTFLFKTLAVSSGTLPNFSLGDTKKARTFSSAQDANALFYALKVSKIASLRFGDVKIIVLPRGENLTAKQIERFFEKTGLSNEEDKEDETEREEKAEAAAKEKSKKPEFAENGFDPTFGMLPPDESSETNLLQFDFIFSRDGGTKPDVDLVEIAGIERSKLYDVAKRVRKVKEQTEAERDAFFDAIIARANARAKAQTAPDEEAKKLANTKRPPIFLLRAFLNLLGDQTTAKKKYQSHLLKVLPQIYTATYFHDPVLLPAFIEKVESNVRNDDGLGFNLLKWDFSFLSRIQNHDGDRLMDIQKSQSYQVGVLLGQLARGLRSKINSFDKNYAGLLSRRISTLSDLLHLHGEINQKLILHSKAGLAFSVSPRLTEAVKNFTGQYNKDECAFGFFDSYFAPYKSREEEAKEEVAPEVLIEGETSIATEETAA